MRPALIAFVVSLPLLACGGPVPPYTDLPPDAVVGAGDPTRAAIVSTAYAVQHAGEPRPAAGGGGAGGGAGGAPGDRDPLWAALGGVQPAGRAGIDGGAGRAALGARRVARRAAAGGGGCALRRVAGAGRGGRRGGGARLAAARLPRRGRDARAPWRACRPCRAPARRRRSPSGRWCAWTRPAGSPAMAAAKAGGGTSGAPGQWVGAVAGRLRRRSVVARGLRPRRHRRRHRPVDRSWTRRRSALSRVRIMPGRERKKGGASAFRRPSPAPYRGPAARRLARIAPGARHGAGRRSVVGRAGQCAQPAFRIAGVALGQSARRLRLGAAVMRRWRRSGFRVVIAALALLGSAPAAPR